MLISKRWRWAIALPLLITGCGMAADVAAIRETSKCTEAIEVMASTLDAHADASDTGENLPNPEIKDAEKAMEDACTNP